MTSTITVPPPATNYPPTIAKDLAAVAAAAKADVEALQAAAVARPIFWARGVVIADVPDLAAFTVAANDGLTYAAGQVVLLANQSTATQNGLYVVGTVASTTAPLTRLPSFAAALAIVNGTIVHVSEGTIWAGSEWKAMCTGACVVAANDPLFYPRVCKAKITLTSGTKTLGAAEGLFLWSVTKSAVQITRRDAAGTVTSTIMYAAAEAGRTAGKSGTAAIIVNACVAAGTIANTDTSTLDVVVTNW